METISFVNYDEQPKLLSLIFGDSNDTVCIILFNIVKEYSGPNSEFTSTTLFYVIYGFFKGSFSIFIEIFFGVPSAFMLKKLRNLTVSTVMETNLVTLLAYLSYCEAEL